ncbi:MAG TPA: winged helix DNA-binding domain-containing protein [Acidimicrobiia bacterium]
MLKISRDQRRARLALRHRLASPAPDPTQAVNSLVALHSSDPVTVYLSVWARVPGFEVTDLERLLYEERSLVRHWAMRRTLWVVDRTLLPHLISSSTRSIGEKERRRTAKLIEAGGVANSGEAWMREALPRTLDAIRRHGEVFTRHLTREVPELSDKIIFTNQAGRVMGTTGLGSRALVQLGMESKVVRARPAGSWVSGQYSWAEIESWLGHPVEEIPVEEASARVVAEWLRAFGPGTEADLKWWTGWTLRQVRRALADVGAVEVDLGDDGMGLAHPEDLDDDAEPEPWVALLPSLDSTTMGWKERDWYIGDHHLTLFDRNGNAGPTVWADGRVVGGWAQRKDGEIVFELFEDVGRETGAAIEARCQELAAWLGGVTITPRFRSPHDKALAL